MTLGSEVKEELIKRRNFLKKLGKGVTVIGGFAVGGRLGLELILNTKYAFAEERRSFPEIAERPEWWYGYEWGFNLRNPGKKWGFTIVRTFSHEEDFEGTKCYVLKGLGKIRKHGPPKNVREEYLTRDLNPVAFFKDGILKAHYEPYRPFFKWPFKIGDEWTQPYILILDKEDGKKIYRSGNFKVVGSDEVKTRIGTFLAFKIVEYDGSNLMGEILYSPQVKYMVKSRLADLEGGYIEKTLMWYSFKGLR